MEEVSNIRVSALFEMLSLNKLINIKEFLDNAHNVNGELKKVEQMKKGELRDLVKATNELVAPSKASPATYRNKDYLKLEEVFLRKTRSFKPEDRDLMEIILEYLDWELQRVLGLNPEQKTELLSCCRDNSYEQDLSVILNLLEKELDHIKIKEHFLSITKKA